MAKRAVRRRRRLERLGEQREPKLVGALCEAEGCRLLALERVYLQELGRKVEVCPTHGKLLRLQIERNENVRAIGTKSDRQLVEEKLGIS